MNSSFLRQFLSPTLIMALAIGWLPLAEALTPDSNFEYSYQAPSSVSGNPGETVEFVVTVLLSNANFPVQSWMISGAVLPSAACRAKATSILGTAAEPAVFSKHETTTGSGNEGYVGAAVLSFLDPNAVLSPAGGPYQLLKVLVEANIPADGNLANCQLQFIDGRQGSGVPVSSIVVVDGQSRAPVRVNRVVMLGNDCNANNQGDTLDIAFGNSFDCDSNSLPDECQNDQDGDGVIDSCDQCAADRFKTAQGFCGCGTADADANVNGVVDCLVTQELGALVDYTLVLVKRLLPKSPPKPLSAVQKQLRTELRAALKQLGAFIKINTVGIQLAKPGVKLTKFRVKQSRWAV